MTTPIITATLAIALSVLLVVLSFRVSLLRQKYATPFGDGGNQTLLRAIRAHGNLGESAPMLLILLLLIEIISPATGLLLWLVAALYFTGRFIAAVASFLPEGKAGFARPITMLSTLMSLLAAGLLLGSALL